MEYFKKLDILEMLKYVCLFIAILCASLLLLGAIIDSSSSNHTNADNQSSLKQGVVIGQRVNGYNNKFYITVEGNTPTNESVTEMWQVSKTEFDSINLCDVVMKKDLIN